MMANYRVHGLPGNHSMAEITNYRDVTLPFIKYQGRRTHKGPRNHWVVLDERTKDAEPSGPFPTLRQAWQWAHSTVKMPPPVIVAVNGTVPAADQATGTVPGLEPIGAREATNDQLISFGCPHCGGRIIGLLARE